MAAVTTSLPLRQTAATVLTLMLLLPACAPSASPDHSSESGPSATAAPKRITAAIMGEPHALYNKLNVGGTIPGTDALEELVHSNLAIVDNHGELAVQLGEAIPSIENGLWKVAADGRMQMTWKIRPGARWHDGTPLTSEDLAFTIRVSRDVPEFRIPVFAGLEDLETLDPSTAVARWERPYINADALFTRAVASPIPRHLLEQSFLDNRAAFIDQPYWTSEFIGTGAFKVRELVRGSHVLLDANPDYALGRPKIDAIEVKFMSGSVIVANILSGAVDVTLGRSISLEQASELLDRWSEGKLDVMPAALTKIYPQMLNPNPAIAANLQFRHALYQSIDRQEMVDSLQRGLSTPTISFLPPGQFPDIDATVRRYEFDPRRSLQLIEELGYNRGPAGLFRDAEGKPLNVELGWTPGDDFFDKVTFSSADYWQRLGVGVDMWPVPQALGQDRSIRANRNGFWVKGSQSGLDVIPSLHSSEALLPEKKFVGQNDSRYISPEYDELSERYQATIPRAERMRVLGELARHINENLPLLNLFYRVEPTMISKRLLYVTARWQGSTQAWNVHLWDLRG